MQIENVARIRFTAGWAAQQQGHLTIGHGLLGQIVIENQAVHAVVTEPLAHRAAGEWRQILHRGRFGGRRGDDDGIFHRAIFFERLDDLGDRRALLADGDVHAVELFRFLTSFVDLFLVQDRVDADRGLAGLAVADDQFALAAPDRDQSVDRLDAGRHRLVHGFARQNAGRLHVDAGAAGDVLDWALAVDRLAQGVHDAAEKALADGNVDDLAKALNGVAFLDAAVFAENNDADIVLFEVQGHALHAARKLDHFAGLNRIEAVHAGDAVADAQHLADVCNLRFSAEALNLLFEDRGDLGSADIHRVTPLSLRS